MSSRHQPEAGADSEFVLMPFRVYIEDWDGMRVPLTVRAIGPHDARNQAKEKARDLGYDVVAVLRVEKAA